MRCADCAVWEIDMGDRSFGLCKRNAPSPTITKLEKSVEYQIVWPKTGKDDWCGQFRSRLTVVDGGSPS